MQLPAPGVFGPPRDRTAAIAVLHRAVELGVDHIDTARYYGPGVANELIRTALHPYRAGLALVSKVGARRDASGGVLRYDRPAELRQGIEDNLRRSRSNSACKVTRRDSSTIDIRPAIDDRCREVKVDDSRVYGRSAASLTERLIGPCLERNGKW